jgi:hypothetical protein
VVARKWADGTDGGTWLAGQTLSRDTVVAMIDGGDSFFTGKRQGTGDVAVIHERCSSACSEEVLRTKADDSTTDNLDHIPCS